MLPNRCFELLIGIFASLVGGSELLTLIGATRTNCRHGRRQSIHCGVRIYLKAELLPSRLLLSRETHAILGHLGHNVGHVGHISATIIHSC